MAKMAKHRRISSNVTRRAILDRAGRPPQVCDFATPVYTRRASGIYSVANCEADNSIYFPGDVISVGSRRSSSTYLDNLLGRASASVTSAGNWYIWILGLTSLLDSRKKDSAFEGGCFLRVRRFALSCPCPLI